MKPKKRVLITGVSGLLGSNLAYCWRQKYEVFGTYVQHPVKIQDVKTQHLDVLDTEQLEDYLTNIKPQVIINCAALTNIDYCEDHPQQAHALNVDLVRNLVRSVDSKDIKLVHISTDNVFDGMKGDYSENDQVNPLNVYGHTKYAGEQQALKDGRVLILRTNIFGWNVQDKQSLAEWCVSELTQGRRIKGFTDAIFSSIYTFDLAGIIEEAVENGSSGLFHAASSSFMSKYDFLKMIASFFGLKETLIDPVSVEDFPFRAKRGKNLSLNINKLSSRLGRQFPTISGSALNFKKYGLSPIGVANES